MQEWFQITFIEHILGPLIVSAVIILVAALLIKLLKRIFQKRFPGSASFPFKVAKAAIIVLALFGVMMQIEPLRTFSISLFAGSGVAAVIIGLAAQESIGNIICGFLILFNKPVNIGEFISIQGTDVAGTVEDISLRHTVVKGMDHQRFIVPNSVMNKQVLHTSYDADPKICSYLFVSVAYTANVPLAIQILAEEVAKEPGVLDIRTEQEISAGVPRVTVRVSALGESAVELKAFVWTHTLDESYKILSDLRIAVLKRFQEENIEIPYPYLNVIAKQDSSSSAS